MPTFPDHAPTERHARQNVVLQQLEHDDMATEQSGRTPAKPVHPKPPVTGVQPIPPSGSPLHQDGLELIRDTNT